MVPRCLQLIISACLLAPLASVGFSQEEPEKTMEEPAAEKQPGDSGTIARRPLPKEVEAKPADDNAIQQRLENILKESQWFKDVKATVSNGIVRLSGNTADVTHKEWATDIAYRTRGVVVVMNQMKVTSTVDFSKSWSVVLDSLSEMWQDFLGRMPLFAAALVILFLTWIAAMIGRAIVGRVSNNSRVRSSLRDLFLQLTTIAAWIVGLLIAGVVVFPGMTPAKLLTVLGLGSVAIGFAFKDIFENFFAGVLILWRFPFDKGDFIQCGDVVGKVEDITIRNTMIRQVDGQLIVAPNGMLFKNPVSVLTNWKSRRVTVMCGVAYGENVDECRDAIREAVASCGSIDTDRDIEIFAQEFGDSSVNFEVTWWTGNTPLDIRRSRDEVVAAVKRKLDDVEIEIPFPYRTLTFKEPLQTVATKGDGE